MTRRLRSVALTLALMFAALSGMLVTTQTASHAFLPAAAPIALTAVRTVVVPAAKSACAAGCRGALKALLTADMLCGFFSGSCDLKWGQNEDVAPNSDQPQSNGGTLCYGGQYTASVVQSVGPNWPTGPNVHATSVNATNPNATGVCRITVRFAVAAGQSTTAAMPITLRQYSPTGALLSNLNNDYASCSGSASWGPSGSAQYTVGGVTYNSCVFYLAVRASEGAAHAVASGPTGTISLTNTMAYAPTEQGAPATNAPTYPNPTRTAQSYKRCSNGTGTVTVAGQVTTYLESSEERSTSTPDCPASYPEARGAGVVEGNPWSPGTVTPNPPAGTPITPVIPEDLSPYLPLQPVPPSKPKRVPAPLAPEYEPLPEYPGTGTQPMPTPGPDGDYCVWGGYVVPFDDCDVASAPAPSPAPTVSAGPSASPGTGGGVPSSGENPDPGDGSQSCLSTGWSWNPVSWVYIPVKCALQWAFVPKPGTFTSTIGEVRGHWDASFPGAYLGAMGGVVTGLDAFAENAQGCGGPVLNLNTGLLQGQYKPLDACPGSLMEQAAVGVRLLLTIGLYLGAAALTARILAASFGLNLGNFGRTD